MSAEHTPGPWHIESGMNGGFEIGAPQRGISGGLLVIAARSGHSSMVNEMRGNARLIAAAPELLAALERLADCVQRQRLPDTTPPAPASPLGEAIRVIKRARGDGA